MWSPHTDEQRDQPRFNPADGASRPRHGAPQPVHRGRMAAMRARPGDVAEPPAGRASRAGRHAHRHPGPCQLSHARHGATRHRVVGGGPGQRGCRRVTHTHGADQSARATRGPGGLGLPAHQHRQHRIPLCAATWQQRLQRPRHRDLEQSPTGVGHEPQWGGRGAGNRHDPGDREAAARSEREPARPGCGADRCVGHGLCVAVGHDGGGTGSGSPHPCPDWRWRVGVLVQDRLQHRRAGAGCQHAGLHPGRQQHRHPDRRSCFNRPNGHDALES